MINPDLIDLENLPDERVIALASQTANQCLNQRINRALLEVELNCDRDGKIIPEPHQKAVYLLVAKSEERQYYAFQYVS